MCLGIPGQIVDVVDEHHGVAEVNGVRRQINIGLVAGDEGGIAVGDWVLIHVGFAMARIDEEEAARTLEALRSFDDLLDDELRQFGAGAVQDEAARRGGST